MAYEVSCKICIQQHLEQSVRCLTKISEGGYGKLKSITYNDNTSWLTRPLCTELYFLTTGLDPVLKDRGFQPLGRTAHKDSERRAPVWVHALCQLPRRDHFPVGCDGNGEGVGARALHWWAHTGVQWKEASPLGHGHQKTKTKNTGPWSEKGWGPLLKETGENVSQFIPWNLSN